MVDPFAVRGVHRERVDVVAVRELYHCEPCVHSHVHVSHGGFDTTYSSVRVVPRNVSARGHVSGSLVGGHVSGVHTAPILYEPCHDGHSA